MPTTASIAFLRLGIRTESRHFESLAISTLRGPGAPHVRRRTWIPSGLSGTRNLAGTGLGDIDPPFRHVSTNARLGIQGDPLTQRPHRIDGGCFARWQIVRHRRQPATANAMRMPSSPARQAVTSMCGELSRQHAMGKRTGRAHPPVCPASSKRPRRGGGQCQFEQSNETKGEQVCRTQR